MEQSESIKELAGALNKFQGAVEKIKKSETNPFFKSKYADLSAILDVIRQPLVENGLSFVQFPTGKNILTTQLMHISGEWMRDSYEMKPTKDDPQGAGSVITYQRRYALGAILGLNIDNDDDANKASEPAKTPVITEWMSEKTLENLLSLPVDEARELFKTWSTAPKGIKKEYKDKIVNHFKNQ
jgi:hypothetical protein